MKKILFLALTISAQFLSAQVFTEVTPSPFEQLRGSIINFADADGDGDLDVLICGWAGGFTGIVKLYLNDGMANFTEMVNPAFIDVEASSLDFSDIDGDGDEDVLIIGFTFGFPSVTETNLYLNDGMGNFTLVETIPFDDLYAGTVAFSDIDGDGDLDVLISGYNGSAQSTQLYLNDLISTSVSPSIAELDFKLVTYPNPSLTSVSQMKISCFSDHYGLLKINVMDLSGRLLSSQQMSINKGSNNGTLDIENLLSGTYFLQIEDGEKRSLQKIIIQ